MTLHEQSMFSSGKQVLGSDGGRQSYYSAELMRWFGSNLSRKTAFKGCSAATDYSL